MLAKHCVYTIRHTDELLRALGEGGAGRFTEGKRWVEAEKLLNLAQQSSQRLPIIFARAEGTRHLFAWATLDEIDLGPTTTYSFSDLQLLTDRPRKTTLRKATDGTAIAEGFIRPYAICQTPRYLREGVAILQPEEVAASIGLREGAVSRVLVDSYVPAVMGITGHEEFGLWLHLSKSGIWLRASMKRYPSRTPEMR